MTSYSRTTHAAVLAAVSAAAFIGCSDHRAIQPETPAEIPANSGTIRADLNSVPAGGELLLFCATARMGKAGVVIHWEADAGGFDFADSACVRWTAPGHAAVAHIRVTVSNARGSVTDLVSILVVEPPDPPATRPAVIASL